MEAEDENGDLIHLPSEVGVWYECMNLYENKWEGYDTEAENWPMTLEDQLGAYQEEVRHERLDALEAEERDRLQNLPPPTWDPLDDPTYDPEDEF